MRERAPAASAPHARGRGRPPALDPVRGAACERVTVRLWSEEVRFLRQMGNGSLADGVRRCIAAAANQPAQGEMAAINQAEPVPTSAISQRVPVASQRERLPVRVPPASRLPASIRAWSDDE
jgi:hypothetical protein